MKDTHCKPILCLITGACLDKLLFFCYNTDMTDTLSEIQDISRQAVIATQEYKDIINLMRKEAEKPSYVLILKDSDIPSDAVLTTLRRKLFYVQETKTAPNRKTVEISWKKI